MPARHRKQSAAVPPGYFAWEAAGLRWLGGPPSGGATVVEVLDEGPDHLDLARLTPAPPTRAAAERLGRGLAATHAAGATALTAAARPGWEGDGWLGPLSEPLPLSLGAWDAWGPFYAQARLARAAPAGAGARGARRGRRRRARPARRPRRRGHLRHRRAAGPAAR